MVEVKGKKVLVMGLGRFGGGVGVAKWLVGEGARVVVNDAEPAEKLGESIKALEGLPIEFKLGGHAVGDFLAADLVVINPAVDKAKSEVVRGALAAGVAWTTEMNLFLERCKGVTVGVTGSVGKSTTTMLIYEAPKAGLGGNSELSRRVFLGGNIGRSLLLELPGIREGDVVVLELSSFMLEDTGAIGWSPEVAVVTNVFPNHLDRHGTLAEYARAKQNILQFQGKEDVAILNGDHELVARWANLARGKVVKFTTRGPANGRVALVIPGEHNQSNAKAAMAVLDVLEGRGIVLDRGAAMQAIREFRGLAHRLELVHSEKVGQGGEEREVRFYNDSKATTPEASITALEAFARGTAIFLVGGYDKHIDLSMFERLLAERAGAVIGIGATGEAMAAAVTGMGMAEARAVYAGTLEKAVGMAREMAAADGAIGAIVLSPASASWDQFANYEKRGERFGELACGGTAV